MATFVDRVLYEACSQGNLEKVQQLLLLGECNMHTKFEDTPLVISSRHGNVEIVRLLLDYGANVDSFSEIGFKPYSFEIKNNILMKIN